MGSSKKSNDVYSRQFLAFCLIGVLVSFISLLVASYWFTSNAVQSKESDSVLLNFAGRQRMLIQKYCSRIDQAIMSHSADDLEGVTEKRRESEEIAEVFESTHQSFIKGGMIYPDAEKKVQIYLPPIQNHKILAGLSHVYNRWLELKKIAEMCMLFDAEPSIKNESVTMLHVQTAKTISLMNSAVGIMQHNSQDKLNQIKNFQIYTIVIEGIIFIIIIAIVYFKIISSFERQGKVLKERENQLISLNSELELVNDKDKVQNWTNRGQAGLGMEINKAYDIESLGQNIINYIAEYLNVQVGIVYVAEDENTLRLAGSYAYSNPQNRSNVIELGEGLVGEAALKKKTVLTTNIPEDYIKIDTGWSKAIPRNILIVPFVFKDVTRGAIELGSHNEFTDIQIDFLEIVSGNIAVVLDSWILRSRRERERKNPKMALQTDSED